MDEDLRASWVQCPECDGLGLHHMDDSPYYPCPTCNDSGRVINEMAPAVINALRGEVTVMHGVGSVYLGLKNATDGAGMWLTPSQASCLAGVLNLMSDAAAVAALPRPEQP